jgi:hypothetical protein
VFILGKRFKPSLIFVGKASGLYYKPMTIVNDESGVITKLETSLSDNARVIIYDHHMFIVQATGVYPRVEHLKVASLTWAQALFANIRLGWKVEPGTNALAYYEHWSLTTLPTGHHQAS